MGEFNQESRLELIHVDGVPSHYREKMSDGGHSPITDLTASYLELPKSINATAYFSGAFKNAPTSPTSSSDGSISDSESKYTDSGLTSPNISATCDSSPSLTGLGIHIQSNQETKTEVATEYGRRLLPQIMDDLAASKPETTVFSLAVLSDGLLKLNPISACQFTRAVDKTAWWLQDQVGTPESVRPMAYIGPRMSELAETPTVFGSWCLTSFFNIDDLRHVLLTYACVKVGYSVCSQSSQYAHLSIYLPIFRTIGSLPIAKE